MRILIAYQYFSFKGGIEHVIGEQATHLARQGYDVSVLTARYLDNNPFEITPKIPIHRISCFNYFYTKFGIPFALPYFSIKNIKTLSTLIREADIVNIHGHPYFFSLIVTLFAKFYKKPIILTQHNTKIKATNPVVNIIYAIADRTIGRFNLAKASVVIAVSNETKKYITSLYPRSANKAVTIYNGIDIEQFKPDINKLQLRKKLNLPLDTFICFTVRRITFKNGIDTLLEAAKLSKDKKVLFLIGGAGPDLDAVKSYVSAHGFENVRLLGFVSDEDLPQYYAAADSFVLPSRQGEGFPMVVLEAFASGLPIIATRSGGHIEVINDQNGLLINPESPTEIVDKIKELRHKDLDVVASYCRNMVKEQFTWKSNIESLTEIINRIGAYEPEK